MKNIRAVKKFGSGLAPTTFLMLLTVLLILSAGCAAKKEFNLGQEAAAAEDWDKAVFHLRNALDEDPDNLEFRIVLHRVKLMASLDHYKKGMQFKEDDNLEGALAEFQTAVELNPANQRAIDQMNRVISEIKDLSGEEELTELEKLKDRVDREYKEPIIRPTSDVIRQLKFSDQPIKQIYGALGKVAGVNILFDDTLRDTNFSIDISDVTFEEALEILMTSNGHAYKIVTPNSIIMYPANLAKYRQYEEQVVRTFYLDNADIKEVQNILRAVVDIKRLGVNQALNSITIRDTPDKVELAAQIIRSNDKAPPEVIVDVEVMEIVSTRAKDYGIGLSTYTINQFVNQPETLGDTSAISLTDVQNLNQNDFFITLPSVIYELMKTDSDSEMLARPQLRISHGEKGSVELGSRVPVQNSSYQYGGGGFQPTTTNYQYQPVGITVEVEPLVHHNDEISMTVDIQVTSILGEAAANLPTFGSRQIKTVIRLKDGETNMLAGLIQKEERSGITGIPGLSDIPILKALFGQNSKSKDETDIVLMLTPHIVKAPDIGEEDLRPTWIGTEEKIQLRGKPQSGLIIEVPADEGEAGAGAATEFPEGPEGGDNGDNGNGTDSIGDGENGAGQGSDSDNGEESGSENGSGGESGMATMPARVSIIPSTRTVGLGEEFVVGVHVSEAENLAHAPFYLIYDPAVLEPVELIEGTFLNEGGVQTTFMADISLAGRIVVGISRLGEGPGVTGSGLLCNVLWRPVADGQTPLRFDNAMLQDPALTPLEAEFIGASVVVREE